MLLPKLPRRYAIIPTHNRPVELKHCIDSIKDQVHELIIIDNASESPVTSDVAPVAHIIYNMAQPPNLSHLWNIGLSYAFAHAQGQPHDVAILNDDAIVPTGWFTELSAGMRRWGTSGVFSRDVYGDINVYTGAETPSVWNRVTGWAFMLRGESVHTFDERFVWWCGDDDMSMRLRINGGLLHVPGFPVENTLANTTTNGLLAEQAAKDMQAFVDKWGVRPW